MILGNNIQPQIILLNEIHTILHHIKYHDFHIKIFILLQHFLVHATYYFNHHNKHHIFYQNLTHKPIGTICVSGFYCNNEELNLDVSLVQNIFEANLVGCVSILNVAAFDLANRKEGFIIGISSVAGDRGRGSNYLYGSAKSGFNTYLDGLRNKLFKFNVKVITVRPGYVRTKMTSELNLPELLMAEPEEIATDIYTGWKKGKEIIYTKWYWKYIMFVIRNIPSFIFNRMYL